MINTKEFVDSLIKNLDIKEVAGVPCNNLEHLITEFNNRRMYRAFTNEGDAVAYAAGNNVSGRRVAVIMQNSGLTNAASPISSLTSLYDIPMIYFVGWRGYPGEPDEPQHKIVGNNTVCLIKALADKSDIGCREINNPDPFVFELEDEVKNLDKTCEYLNRCCYNDGYQTFILVKKGTFSPVEDTTDTCEEDHDISRIDIIREIKEFAKRKGDVSIISTTGYTSRELMSLGEDSPNNFYCLGSMGCAYPFAIGLARANPHRKFIVIDGDGSTAMRFENSFIHSPSNLFRVVVVNHKHQSTGGQGFMFYPFKDSLKDTEMYYEMFTMDDFKLHLNGWYVRACHGVAHSIGVLVEVNNEVPRDLPRSKLTPKEIIDNFKKGLKEEEKL